MSQTKQIIKPEEMDEFREWVESDKMRLVNGSYYEGFREYKDNSLRRFM